MALVTLLILSFKYFLRLEANEGFFHHFSVILWVQITLFASGGLLVAAVIKHTDCVQKEFGHRPVCDNLVRFGHFF